MNRKQSTTRIVVAATGIVILSGAAMADPMQWTNSSGGNGHWYEYKSAPQINWDDAREAALQETWEVSPGGFLAADLVTITSETEHLWLMDNIYPHIPTSQGDGHAWIGGFQDLASLDYSEPDGAWTWTTGEPWGFTNWERFEPNNNLGIEHHAEVWCQENKRGLWNDHSNIGDSNTIGYIIEFTPEPATLSLLVLGGVFVLARRQGTTRR